MTGYAELATATNFSFLRGASHPAELVTQAVALGHAGIGIADRNTVAGVVRAYSAVRKENQSRRAAPPSRQRQPFLIATGTRFCFADNTPDIIAYPVSRTGWGSICRILTTGNRRTSKGDCKLYFGDILENLSDLLLIVMPPPTLAGLGNMLARLSVRARHSVWLGATMLRRGDDERRLRRLVATADKAGVPLIAVNDVLYHMRERRELQDVLTCIREGVTIQSAGRMLESNAERHLKSADDMAQLFRSAPKAIDETVKLLERASFDLGELRYEYPEEPVPPGRTPQDHLEHLVWTRAHFRMAPEVLAKFEATLRRELELIKRLDFACYFLTIYEIVAFAESKGILCQGRGSAANSIVCYLLGVTCVSPDQVNLLFDRFLSSTGDTYEPPDIDVDFEHQRREEVIQHIYLKYGRHRAGIAATVIHYRPRSTIRDVGKVMGLTEDVTSTLSANTAWWDTNEYSDQRLREVGLDPHDALLTRTRKLAAELVGFPRHLSQHVGGFVLTQNRLDEFVPIGNAAMDDRTFIEWDKDDIDDLGILKVDVLGLGMLTCIRKCFDLLNQHKPREHEWRFETVEPEESEVYDMLCKGDSVGVFQVESRAQINMLPRLKPREYYDLVIEVAIVRPGPIQGDMVHPYLRRRDGIEDVAFPSPAPEYGQHDELRKILERTLGVPLFQEQAMQIALDAAKFTPSQAHGLRRAMATFRSRGMMHQYERMMIEGMIARGYDPGFAQRCFDQIKGFGEYGFPQSHAASFAKLVYISSWLKCFHPEVFTCALLNAQPMGFYAPAQLVRDLQEHGGDVRAIDAGSSIWDNSLEPTGRVDSEGREIFALRLGFRQLDGFREEWAERIVAARGAGYPSVEALMRRARLPRAALEKLAEADAFRSMGLSRRDALWAVRRLADSAVLPLFQVAGEDELGEEPDTMLPVMALSEHVVSDYRTVRLSLKGHPMEFLREAFREEGVLSCAEVTAARDGRRVKGAGVVLIRQRPGKGNAIFMTLEDETGIVNVVIWARMIEAYRKAIVGSRLIMVEGKVQKSKEGVIHLMAEHLEDRTALLRTLSEDGEVKPPTAHNDGFAQPDPSRHPRNVRILPKSRDFH